MQNERLLKAGRAVRVSLLSVSLLAAGLLFGCAAGANGSAVPSEASAAPTAEATPELVSFEAVETPGAALPAETPAPEATAGAADENALNTILADISENYHPGTAGSSLTAARFAGMLLDWYTEQKPGADALRAAAEGFAAGLETERAALFAEQMQDIYEAAQGLTGENAEELLETAGYEPVHNPWLEADVTALFAALGADTADMPALP